MLKIINTNNNMFYYPKNLFYNIFLPLRILFHKISITSDHPSMSIILIRLFYF